MKRLGKNSHDISMGRFVMESESDESLEEVVHETAHGYFNERDCYLNIDRSLMRDLFSRLSS